MSLRVERFMICFSVVYLAACFHLALGRNDWLELADAPTFWFP